MSFKLINFVNLNTVFFKKKHISSKYNRARDTKFRLLYKAKQEVKKFYGDITERKLKTVYKLAFKNHQSIITKLEATISTVLFRLNYVTSVYAAKQLVSHGHILINGKKMTIPSYILKTGDIIQIPNKVSEKFKTKNIQSILTGNLSPTINLKSDISPENISISSKELVLNKGLKSINLINSNLAKTITIIIRYKNLIKRP
jgi:ribosomal protein S4